MKSPASFQFSAFDLFIVVLNLLVFGGALTLLALHGPSGPLVLIIIGTGFTSFGRIASKLVRGNRGLAGQR